MEQPVQISVVICSYNRRDYIIDAMDSLHRQTLDRSAFEVIVVDNNSKDDTESRCRAYISTHMETQFLFLTEKRQGASFARNTGAALAQGELLVFMDDDAVAAPDFLKRIIIFFETHPGAGGMGGRIIPRYIPAEPKWMSHFVSSLVGNFDYSPHTVEFAPLKYPLESNMVVRKADFDAVGGFNTELPGVKGTLRIGGEGKEFFFKLKNLGRTIWYDPEVKVEHVVEVSKLTREYMYRVASGIGRGESVRTKAVGTGAYYKKIAEYLYKLCGSIVLGLLYTVKGQPAKALPVIHFRIDALRGLTDNKR
ncbi:glycosyltransferase family 2 protein [Dinghuibacter silviterrae]|uniref:GT2 family glycosyltransferase n=1 Tax=Dinghuibacter silviterrae TaxID=1539049 RepID=A0A4R8DG91_9BACT|nr:glycosyltransferase [Dinghuibacter silviterrae]TDW96643.1 GT2 family glycosyltransferase [Dinghuibacter silviterrae]